MVAVMYQVMRAVFIAIYVILFAWFGAQIQRGRVAWRMRPGPQLKVRLLMLGVGAFSCLVLICRQIDQYEVFGIFPPEMAQFLTQTAAIALYSCGTYHVMLVTKAQYNLVKAKPPAYLRIGVFSNAILFGIILFVASVGMVVTLKPVWQATLYFVYSIFMVTGAFVSSFGVAPLVYAIWAHMRNLNASYKTVDKARMHSIARRLVIYAVVIDILIMAIAILNIKNGIYQLSLTARQPSDPNVFSWMDNNTVMLALILVCFAWLAYVDPKETLTKDQRSKTGQTGQTGQEKSMRSLNGSKKAELSNNKIVRPGSQIQLQMPASSTHSVGEMMEQTV